MALVLFSFLTFGCPYSPFSSCYTVGSIITPLGVPPPEEVVLNVLSLESNSETSYDSSMAGGSYLMSRLNSLSFTGSRLAALTSYNFPCLFAILATTPSGPTYFMKVYGPTAFTFLRPGSFDFNNTNEPGLKTNLTSCYAKSLLLRYS